MSKRIPQTGITDGPDEPSPPPHDRGHDRPEHVAVGAATLAQFDLDSVRLWLDRIGRQRYCAMRLMIMADGGG